MDARILEIVFYLMDSLQENDDHLASLSEYSVELKGLGYSEDEISFAYNWILEHLQSTGENLYTAFPHKSCSSRILSIVERTRLTPEAHGVLLKLFNLGLINNEQLEKIIDRLSMAGPRVVTPAQVKLIASALMFDDRCEIDFSLMGDCDTDLPSQPN